MIPPRIAVIDDSALILRTMQLFLTARGYDVVLHDRAADALPFICQHQPTLVISELHLEYPNAGLDVVRALRGNPTTAEVPILLVSTDPELVDRVARIDSPHVAALSKHVDVAVLLASVDRLAASEPRQ